MEKLYPIIRRKRRPLIQANPEMLKAETLKPDRLPPVAVVPLVASMPTSKPKKTRDGATKN